MKKYILLIICLLINGIYVKASKAQLAFRDDFLVYPQQLTIWQVRHIEKNKDTVDSRTLDVLYGFEKGIIWAATYANSWTHKKLDSEKQVEGRIKQVDYCSHDKDYKKIILRDYEAGTIDGKQYFGKVLYNEVKKCLQK